MLVVESRFDTSKVPVSLLIPFLFGSVLMPKILDLTASECGY
jgi:hypothetical protein